MHAHFTEMVSPQRLGHLQRCGGAELSSAAASDGVRETWQEFKWLLGLVGLVRSTELAGLECRLRPYERAQSVTLE